MNTSTVEDHAVQHADNEKSPVAVKSDSPKSPPTRSRAAREIVRTTRFVRRELRMAILVAVLIAATVSAASVWFTQYRQDSRVDETAARSAVDAAATGTVALLSYAPDTIDRDFASAKTYLTGDFLAYYSQFTQQIVAPAAKEKSVKTTAVVVRSAVRELRPDSAVVLVFINQTTTSADKPDPAMTASSVRVTLTRLDDQWRISSFEPV